MEEYLQHMKALRFQMNDVENQAAKISFEEQRQLTTIQTMENDITSAKSESLKVRAEIEKMMQAKGQICSQILEKQHKAAALESDSSTLSQTLELIIQEKVSLSGKLVEKSEYYKKVAEDINAKLQQQQIWINANNISSRLGEYELVHSPKLGPGVKFDQYHQCGIERTVNEMKNKKMVEGYPVMNQSINEAKGGPNHIKGLEERMLEQPFKEEHIALFPDKTGETKCLQSLKDQIEKMKPGLWDMDIKALEEEYTALLSDKAEEAEYLQSLGDQIEKIKGITHVIKCACGEKYKVGVDDLLAVSASRSMN